MDYSYYMTVILSILSLIGALVIFIPEFLDQKSKEEFNSTDSIYVVDYIDEKGLVHMKKKV
jgi:hypothetical protein